MSATEGAVTPERLLELWDELVPVMPEWWDQIRDADQVDVRASRHVPAGTAYAMESIPGVADVLLVICAPSDEPRVRELVRAIRSPTLEA